MKRDAYQTFIGAKGVAFTWIGAAIGPIFFVIGLEPEHRAHLVLGLISFILVAISVLDGVKALKVNSWPGVLAFSIVPVILLIVGIVFALSQGAN